MRKKDKNKQRSRELRELALTTLDNLSDMAILDTEDLATSLVRQWVTYDGHATLFLGKDQLYFHLYRTPLGVLSVAPDFTPTSFLDQIEVDWEISENDLADVIEQLNRGQSAEVTNRNGVPLRIWVNPQERRKGVEPLVTQPVPPNFEPEYEKIARDVITAHVEMLVNESEFDKLAQLVARQWREHDGHACIFINPRSQLVLIIKKTATGSDVKTRVVKIELDGLLKSFGITPDDIPRVVAQFNLGQTVKVVDPHGVTFELTHDPKTRQVSRKSTLAGGQERTPRKLPPIVELPFVFDQCGAVLNPWTPELREQACPLCGHFVRLA